MKYIFKIKVLIFLSTYFLVSYGKNNLSPAEYLNERYAKDNISECEGKPAYYCSGIMIRTVIMSNDYHEWEVSPASLENQAVSFSYLRKDINTRRLYHDVGFIFKEQDNIYSDEYTPRYKCGYPIDGWTAERKDGCGNQDAVEVCIDGNCSTCNENAITKPSEWLYYWNSLSGDEDDKQQKQCSLNVLKPKYFNVLIKAHNYASFDAWNEVVLFPWSNTDKLPIEAFFYVESYDSNVQEALNNVIKLQEEYLEETNIKIPIVKLLIEPDSGEIHFEDYENSDNGESLSCDEHNQELGISASYANKHNKDKGVINCLYPAFHTNGRNKDNIEKIFVRYVDRNGDVHQNEDTSDNWIYPASINLSDIGDLYSECALCKAELYAKYENIGQDGNINYVIEIKSGRYDEPYGKPGDFKCIYRDIENNKVYEKGCSFI